MEPIVVLIGMVGLAYLVLILPMQVQNRRVRNMQRNLVLGDEVVTAGGMVGRIRALDDNEVRLEVAPGVELRVLRGAISRVISSAGDIRDDA